MKQTTISPRRAGLPTVDARKINLDEEALVVERSCDALVAKGEGGSYSKVWQQIAQGSLLQVTTEQIVLFSANF